MFSILTNINSTFCRVLFEKKSMSHKIFFIRKLMMNNNEKMRQGFHIWREWKINKRSLHMKGIFDRVCDILSERRHVEETFRLLKNQREIDIVRNYINSLWRWKTSNIEAQYYTKFINIFKES